jgi:CBS domain-containing protein
MTQPPVVVRDDAALDQVVGRMIGGRVGCLPVVDAAGRLVGIVTEGDFLRRTETATERKRPRWLEFLMGPGHLADEYVHTHGRKISEVMTADPLTVAEDTALEKVVALMEKKRVKRIPVVRGDKVVGIVSRANLLHALARLAAEATPTKATDTTIRELLLKELAKESWAPTGALEVIVRNGIVDLWGTITDERERQALIVAAENVPGVKRVNDHVAVPPEHQPRKPTKERRRASRCRRPSLCAICCASCKSGNRN